MRRVWSIGVAAILAGTQVVAAHALSIVRSDNGARVAASALEDTLRVSSVVVRLKAGERIDAFGLAVESQSPAIVLVTLSSGFVAAAVLKGQALSATQEEVPTGKMIVLPIGPNAKPQVALFHAGQFLVAPPRHGFLAADAGELQKVAIEQEDGIYWGRIRRTAINVQAPLPPIVEAVRRDYLNEPTVVRVRQAAGDSSDRLAVEVAEQFVAALERRDVDGVRALMLPSLFLTQESAAGGNWLYRRHVLASNLVRGGLPSSVRGASVSVEEDGRVIAKAPSGKRWEVVLSPLDSTIFVSAFEPVR